MILQLQLRLPELDNQSITQELEAIRAQVNDGFADIEKEKQKENTYRVIT